MAVEVMAGHDDAEEASGQCASACGALMRVRRACVWRARRACATPLPQSGAKPEISAHGQRDVAVSYQLCCVGVCDIDSPRKWRLFFPRPMAPLLQKNSHRTRKGEARHAHDECLCARSLC